MKHAKFFFFFLIKGKQHDAIHKVKCGKET
jgi:hypothetical protein